jgi:hypothetical protein
MYQEMHRRCGRDDPFVNDVWVAIGEGIIKIGAWERSYGEQKLDNCPDSSKLCHGDCVTSVQRNWHMFTVYLGEPDFWFRGATGARRVLHTKFTVNFKHFWQIRGRAPPAAPGCAPALKTSLVPFGHTHSLQCYMMNVHFIIP